MRIAGVALISLLNVAAASAQNLDAMTKEQAQTLSSADLFSRGVAILSKEYSGRLHVDWQHPYQDKLLQDVWLTKPMRPIQPGLCMGEYLDIGFEPVEKGYDLPPDPPVTPRWIRPGKRYAIAGPLHYFPRDNSRDLATKATDCSGISWPDAYNNFPIQSDGAVEFGVPLLAQALDSFPQRGSKLRVSCYRHGPKCRDARALFAAFRTSMIADMQGCTVGPFPRSIMGDNDECIVVWLAPKSSGDDVWKGCSWWLRIESKDGRLEATFDIVDCGPSVID